MIIIVLSLVTLWVLSIPSFQNNLAHKLTNEINKNFETEIKVEGVFVGFDGAVNLASFFIADHCSDTLFYAKNFKTDLYSIRQWVNGDLYFSNTSFENVFFKIIKYQGEENNSLAHFTDKLLAHAQPKKGNPTFVRIDNLNITDGRFLLIDKNSPQKSLKFQEIKLQVKDLYIVNKGVELTLKNLEFVSNDYGKLNFKETKIHYNPCAIDISAFHFLSGESYIEGNINLLLPEADVLNFNDQVKIKLNLDGKLSNERLKYFIDLPDDFQPVKIKLIAQGNPNDLKFSVLEVDQDVIQINAILRLKEIFSNKPIQVEIDLKNLKIITSELKQVLPLNFNQKIPEPIFSYPPLEGRGSLFLSENKLTADIQCIMGKAKIGNQSLFQFKLEDGKYKLNQFEGISKLEKLDLSSWNSKLGSITTSFSLSGISEIEGHFHFNFDLNTDEIQLNNTTFRNIIAKGQIKDKILNARFSIKDQHISATAAMAFSWAEFQRKYQLDLNLDQLNLHLFDPQLGGGKAIYSGNLNSFVVGNTFDDLQGNLLFKNLQFENQSRRDSFNDFILETSLTDKKRIVRTINSEIMAINFEGEFQLSELMNLFTNAFAEAFPFVQKRKIEKKQDLIYDISIQTTHLNAIFPELFIDKKAIFRGILSTEEKFSKMTLSIPKITFRGINTENIELQLDNQNPLFNTYVSVGKIQTDSYTISDYTTLGIKRGEVLNFRTEFSGKKDKNDYYELNYTLKVDDKESLILLKKSIIKLDNNSWTLNPKSDKEHLILFDSTNQKFDLRFLEAHSDNERIELKGKFESLENYRLYLNMDKVSLQNLAIPSKKYEFKGAMDLSLNIQRSPTNNALKFKGLVNNFMMNDVEMGSLRFFTSGNTQLKSYEVKMFLSHLGKEAMKVNGNILWFNQTPSLDLDINFDAFDLSFLSPLGGDNIDEVRGEISGNMNLWGLTDALKQNGQLTINNAGFRVPEINTDYRIADGSQVTLIDKTFKFNATTFEDTIYKTQASLVGEINHNNFVDWGYDLKIASDRLLVLNIPEEEDQIFFGDGFFKGKVRLHGPSKNLTINLLGSTEEGTSIKIPWADDYGLADTSFIKFIDKKKNINIKEKSAKDSFRFNGLQMNFELDVNTNAEIKVVIDKKSGSFLSGRGAGNILMEIDTKGKFNMWGDFITYDGIYNFKNLGVIDKKFNLKQGGTIVWEGDPLGAQMDLEAVYNVPGGANPALLLDNPNFNRKIPTEVLIRLQGNLLKPDDPIFEIHFPNTGAVFTSEINYRLSDPQISQLQAISLLSQGIFINEVSLSVQGITNNLYEKASDLFSNLLGDNHGKLQVGVNYLQGDKNKVLDINSEDRLGLTLTTQITDKILLNGNIGVPMGGIEETLIVGDLQIDFILNEEGSLKAKVFNKENEFRYIGDELGYTQGVGLSYQVDFETFRELLSKIIKGSQASKAFQKKPLILDPSELGINFVNKK